jgi:hypothetical protein
MSCVKKPAFSIGHSVGSPQLTPWRSRRERSTTTPWWDCHERQWNHGVDYPFSLKPQVRGHVSMSHLSIPLQFPALILVIIFSICTRQLLFSNCISCTRQLALGWTMEHIDITSIITICFPKIISSSLYIAVVRSSTTYHLCSRIQNLKYQWLH